MPRFNPIGLICGDNPVPDCMLNLAGAGRCEALVWLVAAQNVMVPDPVMVRGCSGEKLGKCVRIRFYLVDGSKVEYVFREQEDGSLLYVHPGFEAAVCYLGGETG